MMLKLFFYLLLPFILLAGCGYQPYSAYSRSFFGENIYVDIEISYRDPENSVLIKDALLEAIVERMGAHVATNLENSDSYIKVSIANVQFVSLAENKQGFTSFYRTHVTLFFRYRDKEGKEGEMSTSGRYTFSIDTTSILTDSRRLDAINKASEQALDVFISRVATLKQK